MGALALRVAKIACRCHPEPAVPEEVARRLRRNEASGSRTGQQCAGSAAIGDPQQAARIDEEDDAMDELHRHLFGVLMDREWKHGWPRPSM
jgi:phosphate transport system protein